MLKNNKRASQFMPFNGLRGYDALIQKAEASKTTKKEITEEHAEELNLALQSLQKGDMAKITYYTAQGYVTEACEIREINCYLHYIRTDKKCFSFKDIWNIQTDAG